jgi:membrane protease YdiL (CAAX protease family)
MLWFQGLAGSLELPSVSNDLELRQLELAALAEGTLPRPMAELLLGEDPRERLATSLESRISTGTTPAPAVERLELALLRRRSAPAEGDQPIRDLLPMVAAERRPLLDALLGQQRLSVGRQQDLLKSWNHHPLLAQLSCEQLGGPEPSCPAARRGPLLLLQLLGIQVLPILLLLLGAVLLIRELWLQLSGRRPSPPPLVGPPLSMVDITLLIAGGFVLIGEVFLPQLLHQPLQQLLQRLFNDPARVQGLQVLILYASLSPAPLLFLRHLLPVEGRPAEGWLQWRWRPLLRPLREAVAMVLMVMPPVALSGWLIDTLWRNPGGSNPMLDLVLTGSDPFALACFAVTAIVLAPLFEETLFRGVLLPALGRRLGAGAAVVLSAALFAAAHLSLTELVPLFLLGCGLGLLRLRSGRLAASVLMHALWNGITFANLLLLAA